MELPRIGGTKASLTVRKEINRYVFEIFKFLVSTSILINGAALIAAVGIYDATLKDPSLLSIHALTLVIFAVGLICAAVGAVRSRAAYMKIATTAAEFNPRRNVVIEGFKKGERAQECSLKWVLGSLILFGLGNFIGIFDLLCT